MKYWNSIFFPFALCVRNVYTKLDVLFILFETNIEMTSAVCVLYMQKKTYGVKEWTDMVR